MCLIEVIAIEKRLNDSEEQKYMIVKPLFYLGKWLTQHSWAFFFYNTKYSQCTETVNLRNLVDIFHV